jgi:hypothetical protein
MRSLKGLRKSWGWKVLGSLILFFTVLYGVVALADLNFGNVHLIMGYGNDSDEKGSYRLKPFHISASNSETTIKVSEPKFRQAHTELFKAQFINSGSVD